MDPQHGSLRTIGFVWFSQMLVASHQAVLCNMSYTATLKSLPVLVVASLLVIGVLAFSVSLSAVLSQVFSPFVFKTQPGFSADPH